MNRLYLLFFILFLLLNYLGLYAKICRFSFKGIDSCLEYSDKNGNKYIQKDCLRIRGKLLSSDSCPQDNIRAVCFLKKYSQKINGSILYYGNLENKEEIVAEDCGIEKGTILYPVGDWMNYEDNSSITFKPDGTCLYDKAVTMDSPRKWFPSIVSSKSIKKNGSWQMAKEKISIHWENEKRASLETLNPILKDKDFTLISDKGGSFVRLVFRPAEK